MKRRTYARQKKKMVTKGTQMPMVRLLLGVSVAGCSGLGVTPGGGSRAGVKPGGRDVVVSVIVARDEALLSRLVRLRNRSRGQKS